MTTVNELKDEIKRRKTDEDAMKAAAAKLKKDRADNKEALKKAREALKTAKEAEKAAKPKGKRKPKAAKTEKKQMTKEDIVKAELEAMASTFFKKVMAKLSVKELTRIRRTYTSVNHPDRPKGDGEKMALANAWIDTLIEIIQPKRPNWRHAA